MQEPDTSEGGAWTDEQAGQIGDSSRKLVLVGGAGEQESMAQMYERRKRRRSSRHAEDTGKMTDIVSTRRAQ